MTWLTALWIGAQLIGPVFAGFIPVELTGRNQAIYSFKTLTQSSALVADSNLPILQSGNGSQSLELVVGFRAARNDPPNAFRASASAMLESLKTAFDSAPMQGVEIRPERVYANSSEVILRVDICDAKLKRATVQDEITLLLMSKIPDVAFVGESKKLRLQ